MNGHHRTEGDRRTGQNSAYRLLALHLLCLQRLVRDASRDRALGAISHAMDTHANWTEFYAWLLATYWEALPPDQRQETQGDVGEGEVSVPEDIWRCAVMMYPEPYAWLLSLIHI